MIKLDLKHKLAALAAGALSLGYLGVAQAQAPANAPPLTKLVLGQTSISAAWATMYMADSLGYFAKHGIQIDWISIPGGPTGSAALINGSVDVLTAPVADVFLLQSKKQDIKVITGLYRPLINALVVRNGANIKTLADLKGKRLAMTQKGTTSHLQMKYLLELGGGKEEDATFVSLGPTPAGWVTAFAQNTVDAGLAFDPVTALLINDQKTAHMLFNFQAGEGPAQLTRRYFLAAVFNEKFVNANLEAVKGFVAAMKEAKVYVSDPKNKDTIIAALGKYIKVPPDVLAQSFNSAAAVENAFDLRVTPDQVAAETEYLHAIGFIPTSYSPSYSDIVDTRFE